MNGLIERYMDEETIRIMCFFFKNKFNPNSRVCKGCARFKLCERDACKMINACGYIPWIEDSLELIKKTYGYERCSSCLL